jgi:hypothetical protein
MCPNLMGHYKDKTIVFGLSKIRRLDFLINCKNHFSTKRYQRGAIWRLSSILMSIMSLVIRSILRFIVVFCLTPPCVLRVNFLEKISILTELKYSEVMLKTDW